jgi:EAL domain-containing protein (putative c-di-GMP-specific phosphodiesterase class I)
MNELNTSIHSPVDIQIGQIKDGLTARQFELFYQPIVGMDTYEVNSIEVLLRWNHPHQGLLLPAQFLAKAEVSDIIGDLTYWALQSSFKQLKAWQQARRHLSININISEFVLYDKEFLPKLIELQQEFGIAPNLLRLEISEASIANFGDYAQSFLAQLSQQASQITIDDFQLKYLTLHDLSTLSFNCVKISKLMLGQKNISDETKTIIKSLVDIAHDFNKPVGIVGVETARTWQFLMECGCDFGQGHYICRPLPAIEINTWLGIKN